MMSRVVDKLEAGRGYGLDELGSDGFGNGHGRFLYIMGIYITEIVRHRRVAVASGPLVITSASSCQTQRLRG